MCVWCCTKDLDEQDLMEFIWYGLDLGCGNIDFKVILAAENSNKFQKTKFWKGKSVKDVVTFEGLPFNSSMISFHICLLKN
jgi:hypothetical protein